MQKLQGNQVEHIESTVFDFLTGYDGLSKIINTNVSTEIVIAFGTTAH